MQATGREIEEWISSEEARTLMAEFEGWERAAQAYAVWVRSEGTAALTHHPRCKCGCSGYQGPTQAREEAQEGLQALKAARPILAVPFWARSGEQEDRLREARHIGEFSVRWQARQS